jgi:hypothetical protein
METGDFPKKQYFHCYLLIVTNSSSLWCIFLGRWIFGLHIKLKLPCLMRIIDQYKSHDETESKYNEEGMVIFSFERVDFAIKW